MKPFCAIYSTFLQRAYDQVVHDVAIQSLPVRFALDRAGPVGADGATHSGSFDLAYLGCLPGFVLMAPSDEAELVHSVATAVSIGDRPSRAALPARRRGGRGTAGAGRGVGAGQGTRPARGRQRGDPVARAAAGGCAARGGRAGGARAADDGGRRPLRQAAGHGAGGAAGAAPRGADHHRGGLDRRLRVGGAASPGVEGPAGRRAEGPADGAARLVHRPRLAGEAARRGAADAKDIVATALAAFGLEAKLPQTATAS